ncbi:MAG: PBP1A family penicillin-binding protein [Rhodospirillales bacterium]|nr:PBP1A family penicillin-binding protein [Rhodospirillales bacterium]
MPPSHDAAAARGPRAARGNGAGKPPRDPKGPKKPRKSGGGFFGRLLASLFAMGVLGVAAACGVAFIGYRYYASDLPNVDVLKNYQPPVMSRVYAGNARLLADLAAERRIFVPFSAIPPMVVQAFVSAEDQSFWVNTGIDPLAIVRAGVFDLTHLGQGRRPIGASTITQQVAKNMLLDSNKVAISRKIREAILAMRIDATLSKQRVMELYLNQIYLGMGAYGVAAAAEAYFNKPLDQLTLPEAAFLGALPKAPNNYNPFRNPDAAKARRDWVLDRMAADHAITQAQADAAKATPIVPAAFHRPPPIPGADWFAEEVRRELIAKFGTKQTTEGGLMVRTSLDPKLQLDAEDALRKGLMAYDLRMGGWHGLVTQLPPAGLGADWPRLLQAVPTPPGMLQPWRLAVVLSVTPTEARLGWLSPEPANTLPDSHPARAQHTGYILLSETRWARPVGAGNHLGPVPGRMEQVLSPGDVVMVEHASLPTKPGPVRPAVARPGHPPVKEALTTAAATSPDHMLLRQIPKVEGALASLDPATGRVVAMVGGWSFQLSQFNRATQAARQPGSSFKPIVYLAAMEKGLSPSQRFLDAPVVIDLGAAGRWRPNNYEMNFGGPTPLRIALEQSLNLVTLRLAEYIGMDAIAKTAIAFHMADSIPLVLPAALGAADTTVLREAQAYGSLDAGGKLVTPSLIDSVQDRDGHVLWRPSGLACQGCADPAAPPQILDQRKRIADPQSVFQVVQMMEGVIQRGTGVPAGAGIHRPLAGKTGTTQQWTDAWFSGFSPDLVTVVWVGFDQPSSLGYNQQGALVAAPIWHDYMAKALAGRPVLQFVPPPGVTLAQWDTGSGTVTDAFKPGQVPGASVPVFAGATPASQAAIDQGMAALSAQPDGNGVTPLPPGGAPGTPGAPAAPAAGGGVDSSMGGLY